ncbi:MAG: Phosphoglucomutase/phosphomannomutase [Candidatus Woesearchaeota archaeon]|nr:Phosphoglucomutase/phosphomannomutase [Candidatus Woesearchaeota archaeon]
MSKRILFGTDGVRGTANKYPITPEACVKLGKAAAIVLKNGKKRPRFIIGKDTRLSGYMVETALMSGIVSVGGEVMLVGPMPTPAVAHLVKSFAADAGIVISASHNPAQDNGIKFFSAAGLKLSDEVEEEIEKLFFSDMTEYSVNGNQVGKAYRIDDALGRYIEFAKSTVNNISLKGMKIVLDCANGAAYKIAPKILRELGANVLVLNNKPDGLNINKGCGATHPELISRIVVEEKADLGLALDGDADRVIMVDENGKVVDGDQILCIAALNMLKKGELKKDSLVVTGYSNLGLDKAIKQAGGRVVRVKNGDRYVIDEMLKKGYNLGGEQSGHIIFFDYSMTGDGTIASLKILRIMKKSGRTLSDLSSCMKKFPQKLINVDVNSKPDFSKINGFNRAIKSVESKLGDSGRTLIRYSGTQNILRIMIESEDKALIADMAKELADIVKKEIG